MNWKDHLLLKCPYYSKWSKVLTLSLANASDTFFYKIRNPKNLNEDKIFQTAKAILCKCQVTGLINFYHLQKSHITSRKLIFQQGRSLLLKKEEE